MSDESFKLGIFILISPGTKKIGYEIEDKIKKTKVVP